MTLIRKMEPKDVPEVHRYGNSEKRFNVSQQIPGFWTQEQLYRWVGREEDVLLVAEYEGQIAGFMLSSLNKATGKALLENLLVPEQYRGRRLGIRLAKECLKKLKANGAKFYVNLVEPDNPEIIRLFEYLGFRRGKELLWMDKSA